MFRVLVKRCTGEIQPVAFRQTGQHMAVHDGQIRMARLWWEQGESAGSDEQWAARVLLDSVPLMDWLILTRLSGSQEKSVFEGLITECSTDGRTIQVAASDDPAFRRLMEAPLARDVPQPQEGGRPGGEGAHVRPLGTDAAQGASDGYAPHAPAHAPAGP